MKILIVSGYYFPEVGAAPSRIANMAKGLKKKGHQVEVLTCMPNYPKGRIFKGYRGKITKTETLDGITIHRYWTYATISKSAIKRFLSMFALSITMFAFLSKRSLIKKYDRVIIQSPPILIAYSAMVMFKKVYSKTVLLNVSDLWPGTAIQLGAFTTQSKAYKVMSYCEKFIYRNADAVIGQSNETLNHILKMFPDKRTFLYRNLQPKTVMNSAEAKTKGAKLKIVYAGLLGVPQDMYKLITKVDFKACGAELHIYGSGVQQHQITKFAAKSDCIFYHGTKSKEEINREILKYDLSIIPLVVDIYGAVPSKIFDIIPAGIPLLFSGNGEGAQIVKEYQLGLVSEANDYKMLSANISTFASMRQEEYMQYVDNCLKSSKEVFSFDVQMDKINNFLKEIQ